MMFQEFNFDDVMRQSQQLTVDVMNQSFKANADRRRQIMELAKKKMEQNQRKNENKKPIRVEQTIRQFS